MLLKKLEEKLEGTGHVLSMQLIRDREIYDLQPLTQGAVYRDDILYTAQDLQALDITAAPANLLWCGEPVPGFDTLSINWIRVRPESFSAVLARIRQELLDSHTLQNLRFHILESLLHGSGLSGIFNEIGETLDTSIVIMDMSGKILASTQPFKIRDPLWQESVARGYCPPFFIEHIRDVRLSHEGEEESDPVFRYRDFSFYDLVDREGAERKLGFYCHPALAILRAYDSENGTDLYELLRSFTASSFNQKQTAAELYLHRNTLSYRKQKIVSLTNLDLEDRETQFLLQCSFRIARYLEKTRQ